MILCDKLGHVYSLKGRELVPKGIWWDAAPLGYARLQISHAHVLA